MSDEELRAELEVAPVVAFPGSRGAKGKTAAADGEGAAGAEDGGTGGGGDGGGEAGTGGDRKRPRRPHGEIWDGCPVRPLGVFRDAYWYLDRLGQMQAVTNHQAARILMLFGDRVDQLTFRYPVFDKSGDRRPNRFDQTACAMDMIRACSERGLFNPEGAVRGVGAWCDDDGRLIWHVGEKLITPEGERPVGEYGGRIYPAYPPVPGPAPEAARGDAPARVLELLEGWHWARPDVEPYLALGMIGAQMIGGALDWRPVFWVTGDKATGKSTLQDLMRHLHGGDRGLVQSNDPTKSGITSRLGHSSLPVSVDELEPGEEGSGRERDIIVLARVAASGGQWLRGSADQKGASGNVYSTFLFSSILIPGAMGAQDRSRLITLSLMPLPADAPKVVLRPAVWRERGAAMRRLMLERWESWPARLDMWRAALAKFGLSGRNGDNYATTLACADMLMSAELPTQAVCDAWARKTAFAAAAEVAEIGSNAEDMLVHLLGQPFDVYRRGELWLVAHWLMAAAQLPATPAALVGDGILSPTPQDRHEAAKRANEKLAKLGLRVRGEGEEAALFLPNKPVPGLRKLFERSPWADGVWAQAARRVPGAEPVAQPLTLAGQRLRGVYVPFRSIGGLAAFPMDRARGEDDDPGAGAGVDIWPEDFA